jgi:hypothetical protein
MLAGPGMHNTLCVGEISEHIIMYKKFCSRVNFENLPNLTMNSVATVPDEIAKWLTIYYNQPIFLGDNLRDLGLTYKLFRRVAAERDDVACAEWLHDIAANLCRPVGLSRRI